MCTVRYLRPMRPRLLALLLLLLVPACGGEDTSPSPASSSGTERASTLTSVPFDTWLVVDGLEGRGVPLGSGVRFRADAFDVVAHGQASSFPLSCPEDGSLACTGAGAPLSLSVVDGRVRATQPGLVLLLRGATTEQAAGFDAALVAADAQRAACRRTARSRCGRPPP